MAAAFQSDGGTVFCNANNNNAISVTLPATRPVGSVLFCIIFNQLITATVTTAPSGYTLLSEFPKSSGTASGGRIWVYYRIVDGTESAPSVACSGTTGTSGDLWGAYITCYSGIQVTAGAPVEDGTTTVNDASGTTTCTYPAITTGTQGALILRFLARFRDAVDTFTPTGGWNEREDAGSTTRLGGQLHVQDNFGGAPGSQASVTVAPSNTTAARYLAISMAFQNAPTTDSLTATLSLTPSATEAAQFVDSGTEGLALTPSGTDLKAKEYTESATVGLALSPSGSDTYTATTNIQLDVADLGHTGGDAGGTSPDITITTIQDTAPGARVYASFATAEGGSTDSAGACSDDSGLGLTWTKWAEREHGNNIYAACFYADLPAGVSLPASTHITCAITGGFYDYGAVASSYTSVNGWASQLGSTDIQAAFPFGSVSTWASASMTKPSSGESLLFSVAIAENGGSSLASAPSGGTVEDVELIRTGTFNFAISNNRKLETSSGTDTNSGTWAVNPDVTLIATGVFPESTGANYTDSATESLSLTPSATETADFVDASTEALALTASATESAQFVDTGTEVFALTPSATETAQFVDASTETFALTPSATEVAAFADAATETFALAPSGSDVSVLVDAATESLALTPSSTEEHTTFDADTETLALTPDSTEVYTPGGSGYTDAETELFALTPSGDENVQGTDTETERLSLQASGTDIQHGVDSETEAFVLQPISDDTATLSDSGRTDLTLTPAGTEAQEAQDVGVETFGLVPSGTDTAEFGDSDTTRVSLVPSGSDTQQTVDTSTEVFALTPSDTDIADLVDSGREDFRLTPSADESLSGQTFDSGTESLLLVPFTTETLQATDSDIEDFRLTPDSTDFIAHEYSDSDTVALTYTPSGTDTLTTEDADVEYIILTPSISEELEYADTDTEYLTLEPQTVFEGPPLVDLVYLSLTPGAIEFKYIVALRGNSYRRYTAKMVENRLSTSKSYRRWLAKEGKV